MKKTYRSKTSGQELIITLPDDDWKEVEEETSKAAQSVPEWEIIEFRSCDSLHPKATWKLCKDGNYSSVYIDDGLEKGHWTLNQMLNGGGRCIRAEDMMIYSARQLPDGEIISIGDYIKAECTHMGGQTMRVEGFIINDNNNLLIKTKEFHTQEVGIGNCKKASTLLFTTEDGVRMYDWNQMTYGWRDGMNTYTHLPEETKLSSLRTSIIKGEEPDWHIFSTLQAALSYINRDGKASSNQNKKTKYKTGDWVTGVGISKEQTLQIVDMAPDGWLCFKEKLMKDGWKGYNQHNPSDNYWRPATESEIKKAKEKLLIPVLLTEEQIAKLKELIK